MCPPWSTTVSLGKAHAMEVNSPADTAREGSQNDIREQLARHSSDGVAMGRIIQSAVESGIAVDDSAGPEQTPADNYRKHVGISNVFF